jgi:hypothetical protein
VERRVFDEKYKVMASIRDQHHTYIEYLELRPRGGRTGVFTTKQIPKGSILLRMQGDLLDAPNKFSIQIDTHTSILAKAA